MLEDTSSASTLLSNESISNELEMAEAESNVAVVTMLGSLCPITLAHIKSFHEARNLLLATPGAHDPSLRPVGLEAFSCVLGFISVNPDDYVSRKFGPTGLPLHFEQRAFLVEMAIADLPWMAMEPVEGQRVCELRQHYRHLNFCHFTMNGADDVFRSKKWKRIGKHNKRHYQPSSPCRFITMGRPGDTQRVLDGMGQRGVTISPDFILGPELPDVSSTAARKALARRDEEALKHMLHAKVAKWCLTKVPQSIWQG